VQAGEKNIDHRSKMGLINVRGSVGWWDGCDFKAIMAHINRMYQHSGQFERSSETRIAGQMQDIES
jgi:hypothetical protein